MPLMFPSRSVDTRRRSWFAFFDSRRWLTSFISSPAAIMSIVQQNPLPSDETKAPPPVPSAPLHLSFGNFSYLPCPHRPLGGPPPLNFFVGILSSCILLSHRTAILPSNRRAAGRTGEQSRGSFLTCVIHFNSLFLSNSSASYVSQQARKRGEGA